MYSVYILCSLDTLNFIFENHVLKYSKCSTKYLINFVNSKKNKQPENI